MRKSNYIQRIESTCTEQYDWYINKCENYLTLAKYKFQ